MRKIMRKKVFFWSLLFSIFLVGAVHAKELTLATGLSIPPYIIQKEKSGIQLDLLREILKVKGHKLERMVYVSNRRLVKELAAKHVDGAINVPPNMKNVHYSKTIIYFKNVAISLKKNDFHLNSIEDLLQKRITAFQNASRFLGPDFARIAKNNKKYQEIVQQLAQVDQLYKGRTDVVISDQYIFQYFRNQHRKRVSVTDPLVFHNILPPSPRKAAFLDLQICADFDEGLTVIRKNGIYQKIIDRYISDLEIGQ